MDLEHENKIENFIELATAAINNSNLEGILALWHEDIDFIGPEGTIRGKASNRVREQSLFHGFPDLKVEMNFFARTENQLALKVLWQGTHTNSFKYGDVELPATGNSIELSFAGLFTFQDGLVYREEAFYDRLILMAQLGVDAP